MHSVFSEGGAAMRDVKVILNPIAGRGAGARLAGAVRSDLTARGLDFDFHMTEGPDHATELARQAVQAGQKLVIAVGGDGTSNEVLNGLLGEADSSYAASDAAGPWSEPEIGLAIVPIGTGNDFAFSVNLPMTWQAACVAIAAGSRRIIDIGSVQADGGERRLFGNGVGIGFDAIVNIESRKVRRLRGFSLYLWAVLKTLAIYYHTPEATVEVDGQRMDLPVTMVSIMNGRRVGGGFYPIPGAQVDDGLVDVCVAAKLSRPAMVGYVLRFMNGSHVGRPPITLLQGRRVTVTVAEPWAAHVDGEIFGVGACQYAIELMPGRLTIVG
jgi:diacylglycerol kinase (ATP)